jgi:riboflavin synthase alpha subunit
MSAAPLSLNMADLGKLVRQWVHSDMTLSNINKEANKVRKEKDAYEEVILRQLKQANYEKAVIQIDGGRLTVNEEKHFQSLTFKSLEEMLHMYYRRPGARKDETDDILKFVKENRTFEIEKRLKKTTNS